MFSKNILKESNVDLLKLKLEALLEKEGNNLVLKNDIRDDNRLLIRSGRYLTETVIEKLLNFGVNNVEVDFDSIDSAEFEKMKKEETFKEQFVKTQSVLVVEKNIIDASSLVRTLVDCGFKEGNIFVTKEPNNINKYFRAKKINFLFIDALLYAKCSRCVDKYSLLRSNHTFVLAETEKSLISIKRSICSAEIKPIVKSIQEKILPKLLADSLNENLLEFYLEENLLIS